MNKHTQGTLAERNGRIYCADRENLTIANIARSSDGDYSPADARQNECDHCTHRNNTPGEHCRYFDLAPTKPCTHHSNPAYAHAAMRMISLMNSRYYHEQTRPPVPNS